jgi:hypothetical protein
MRRVGGHQLSKSPKTADIIWKITVSTNEPEL